MHHRFGFFALIFALLPVWLHAFEVDVQAPDELVDDLRAASLVAALPSADKPSNPIDVISAAQADYGRLIALLYERGHFGPTISILVDGREAADLAPVAAPPRIERVQMIVDPGPVFSFGTVSVRPTAPDTQSTPGFSRGEVARISTLRAATANGIEGWRQQGHAKADVARQSITARHPEQRLDADVVLDPGPRLRLGRLTTTGSTIVPPSRLAEIAGWPQGEVYDPDTLAKVEKRLRRTGTFSTANLTEAQAANADNTLDVTATINDQLPRRYTFGADLSTDDGVSLLASWLHRNIFGGAERLSVEGEIRGLGADTGGVEFKLGTRLSRPATLRTDLEAFALAEIEQLDTDNLFSRTARVEVGAIYFASDDREYSYGIGLETAESRDALGERDYTILTFPFSAKFDRRDKAFDATSGYYAEARVMPFVDLGGTEHGVLTTLDLRTYRRVSDRVVLAFRGLFGSLAGPDLDKAPANFLFYSGGGGTVRGQKFESLGIPVSPTEIVGGRSFLGISGEVRVKTGEKLSVVGFYDAGYVGPDSFIASGSGEWHSGIGAGLRYDTGIGPIRFDVAVPASGPGNPSGFEIYIGIGQAF